MTDFGQWVQLVSALSLSEFERGTYVLRMRSHLLAEDVFLISRDELLDCIPEDVVAYTARELRNLMRRVRTQDRLKQVHELKKVFDGEILL